MAPRTKPAHLKLIQGNPGKRPIMPDRFEPAKPSKPLAPPAHLDKYAKAEWKRMNVELHRLGLLTSVDRATFEAYCVSYGVYRLADERLRGLAKLDPTGNGALVVQTKAGNSIHNPIFSIRQKALADMVKYATEFGFTPSSRAQAYNGATAGVAPGRKAEGKAAERTEDSFFDD